MFQRVAAGASGDAPGTRYLHDVGGGQTTPVAPADASSPQLSRDGQWALFTSAGDLVGDNPYGLKPLYAQRIGGAAKQITRKRSRILKYLVLGYSGAASAPCDVVVASDGP